MPLTLNAQAPAFTLPSTAGGDFSLESLAGRACILYFYPKDFTAVCSKEACSFRDQFAAFRKSEVPVFGVSRDRIETHLKFKEQYQLPFDLLSDLDGRVAKAYKARVPILGITKRITYLLAACHKIVAIHDALFGDEAHVEKMIDALGATAS